jgi:ABC-2 type transport system permease protein
MTDAVAPAPMPGRAPRQPGIGAVLTPKWRSALARSRESERGRGARLLLFAVIAAVFWSAAFGISYRVLGYISTQEIGTLLASKMLGVILLAFAAILLLSNLITALSSYFLAKDLDLLVAAPLHWFRLYVAKLIETAAHSSWMVGLIALPIFTAYGIVFKGGLLFPFVALAAFIPFIILPAVIGSAVTLVLVNVFPARRARDLLSLVAIGAVGGAVLVLRLMRPEQLVRPEGFRSLVEFIGVLRAPTNPFLPTEWASDMIMNWLTHVADPLPITLLYTTAAAFVIMGGWLHGRLFRDGYSKSQEGAERFVRGRRLERVAGAVLGGMAPARREFLLKDLRLFFRDPTQWSQLILLGVLLVVYLFNIRSLPLFSGERVPFFLVTVIVFLNLGLAGFVLSAIAARFVFPAVSLEGRQMWLIHSSPVDFRTLLWSKYWLGTLPLILLAVFITAATNVLLRASAFMMLVSVGTLVLFTFAASAMALCFGAFYPKFDTENAAQIPTSFGGLVFMMSSISLLGLLIAVEAVPIGAYLRAHQAGESLSVTPGLIGAGAVVLATCVVATIAPLRLALRRLETMEW